MARCTVPRVFGFGGWFEARFGYLCEAHDYAYMTRRGTKLAADLALYRGIKARGFPILAALTFAFCMSPYGWWLWWRE